MFIDQSKKIHFDGEVKEYWAGAYDINQEDTARHFKMLETALPLCNGLTSILSIGDHRGRDAAFFKQKTGCRAVASDLNASTLSKVVQEGWIDDCSAVDVENIPFPDNSFDFVIAKEAFHHFPRPMLGVYEMLRVAKLGIILIEPNDDYQAKQVCSYVQPGDYNDNYEDVGNYVYRISLREMLKSAWSLFLPRVIAVGFNDPYQAESSYQSWLERKAELDKLIDTNERPPNLITIGVFKTIQDQSTENIPSNYKIYNRPLSRHEINNKVT